MHLCLYNAAYSLPACPPFVVEICPELMQPGEVVWSLQELQDFLDALFAQGRALSWNMQLKDKLVAAVLGQTHLAL